MSSKEIDEYKRLYSEYIEHAVKLHNYHRLLIRTKGKDVSTDVRRELRKMMQVERRLWVLTQRVVAEHKQNLLDEHRAAKAEKARIKALPRIRKPKKDQQNDNNN